MTMLQILTQYIRERIIDDQIHLPNLYAEARQLGLRPQPWWDKQFYDHTILRRKAEIELRKYEKQAQKISQRRTK